MLGKKKTQPASPPINTTDPDSHKKFLLLIQLLCGGIAGGIFGWLVNLDRGVSHRIVGALLGIPFGSIMGVCVFALPRTCIGLAVGGSVGAFINEMFGRPPKGLLFLIAGILAGLAYGIEPDLKRLDEKNKKIKR